MNGKDDSIKYEGRLSCGSERIYVENCFWGGLLLLSSVANWKFLFHAIFDHVMPIGG